MLGLCVLSSVNTAWYGCCVVNNAASKFLIDCSTIASFSVLLVVEYVMMSNILLGFSVVSIVLEDFPSVLSETKNSNPSIWKTLKFGRETIIWSSYTGHSNIWEKSVSVVWRCFFPEHLILNFFRLKVKLKVDLLKLMLKLTFPHNYFQIPRQKKSKSFYLENIKVWTILVQFACLASCECIVVQSECLASWGS